MNHQVCSQTGCLHYLAHPSISLPWRPIHRLRGLVGSTLVRVLLSLQSHEDLAPPMARRLFSPYGPRPRRSARVVLAWTAVFLGLALATYALAGRRHGAPARLADGPGPGDGRLRSPRMRVVE